MALVLVCLLWGVADALDAALVETLRQNGDLETIRHLMGIAEDARTIVTTVSAAMMTFIGVVFSISLVAVQMAAGNLTPRIVRIFIRSRISKLTFAVFLATFLLSLLVLTSYDSDADPRDITTVPLLQSALTVPMVVLSLVLFIAYVTQTLQLMKVGPVVERINKESLDEVARMPVQGPDETPLAPEIARMSHQGHAGVLRDAHIARLVRVARRNGVVLRLIPRIGDYVVPGTPVLAVHGPRVPARSALRHTVSVGVERTFHQDLGFGLRQLSDIALRALSPAVNDPTTAVQCLDRIIEFLAVVAARPLGAVHHRDRKGVVRLVQNVPG